MDIILRTRIASATQTVMPVGVLFVEGPGEQSRNILWNTATPVNEMVNPLSYM